MYRIGEFSKGDKPNKEIIRILEDKADGVDEALRTEQERIQRLRTNIFLLKNGGIPMENNVTIKMIEPILVTSLSKKIYDFDDMGPLWETLNHEIDLKKGKKSLPCMTLYHDGFDASKGIKVEVIEPLSKAIESTDTMKIYELPAHSKVACIVHIGSFQTIGMTYGIIQNWIKENQYESDGPVREIYHKGDWITENENEYVTEIQYLLK